MNISEIRTLLQEWPAGARYIKVVHTPHMGKGAIALKSFAKGEFVLPYMGELRLTNDPEWEKRKVNYAKEGKTCYHLDIETLFNGLKFTIDPTESEGPELVSYF